MKLNWISYFPQYDGYGRFSTRMIRALQNAYVDVHTVHVGDLERPAWLLDQLRIDWDRLTIACMPPYMLKKIPGRQWLFSMTEGSVLPDGWVDTIHESGVERVIVPCQHNAKAFHNSGVNVPVDVVAGGTDPEEFPLRTDARPERPYTFLTIADRNERKGWHEVWAAFYRAFGGKTTGVQDVRLIIKYVPADNIADDMSQAEGADPRIVYQNEKADDMAAVYAQADCLVLPSRSEGWGMPHRECAMMGIPVITQAYSGLDDGFTHRWAIVVKEGTMQPIPKERFTSLGEWRVADVQELADWMRRCYDEPVWAYEKGYRAAQWLGTRQTWKHSVEKLMDLVLEGRLTDYARQTARPGPLPGETWQMPVTQVFSEKGQ